MTLPLLLFPFRQWHDSMFFVSALASIARNTPWILSSRASSLTDSGMPEISRYSLLGYCSLAQHFRSVTTKRSINFTFTFRDIVRSDSILVNLVFSSSNSAFIEPRELSNLCWQSSTMLASSSLVSFIRDEREYAMMQVCCYERKVTTTFHLPELSTYVCTPQRHMSDKKTESNMILMLIMMLKFCAKESRIGLENFGATGFFITAGLGQCFPYQLESVRISPDLYPPHFLTRFLHYYYLKLEIKK